MDEQQNIGPQPDRAAGDVSAQAVNVIEAGVRDVFAHTMTITQGGARDVKADNVIVRLGGAQTVEATNVTVRQGSLVQAKAQTIEIVQSAVALAQGDKLALEAGTQALGVFAGSVTMDGSFAQAVVSRGPVEVEQSATAAVIAPHVAVKSSLVGLLFARHVEGDVNALFGPRAAVAFGAAFGAAFGVAFALARMMKGQRKR
jgi:hypothetical protein